MTLPASGPPTFTTDTADRVYVGLRGASSTTPATPAESNRPSAAVDETRTIDAAT